MQKLLIAILFFSISSIAQAKVEIWLCNSMYGIDVFKIDSTKPLNTSQRIQNHWKNLWNPSQESAVENIIYDPNLKQVKMIYNNEQDKKEIIFDLVTRDLIIKFKDKNKSNTKWSCELK